MYIYILVYINSIIYIYDCACIYILDHCISLYIMLFYYPISNAFSRHPVLGSSVDLLFVPVVTTIQLGSSSQKPSLVNGWFILGFCKCYMVSPH